MEPLASRMRPSSFDDVYGQDHLVGEQGVLRKMLSKNKRMSMILYGPPGTGKTTIAGLFADASGMDAITFNASTDNKSRLRDIIDTTAYHDILVIIDEIHRMKTDVQDFLLPFVENGKVVMIGLTTLNPFQSINMAIRSRCHLFEVRPLDDEAINKALERGLSLLDVDTKLDHRARHMIITMSNHDIRTALNLLESASIVVDDGEAITSSIVSHIAGRMAHDLDDHGDHYYNLLSALQKSIRGSDVDAALHYLARLLVLGDLQVIFRRLLVICYEDIGLANPMMGPKVTAAIEAASKVGMPEARIILSVVVIDMAISPKSNTAVIAIDQAIGVYESRDTGTVPDHANNTKIKLKPEIYHYPHDDDGSINSQTYLPEMIKDDCYYHPKDESSYEQALAKRLALIDTLKRKKRSPKD
ncbi:MAG: replication-associated recombination protein A [Acholeplasmataceae bacterium]|nr:replication-associated recombination protein A [Acholeplasmataceae bacterium]